MKKLLILTILLISSCSTKDELYITDENKLFSVTRETAVLVCGGKSRLIESKNAVSYTHLTLPTILRV